MANGVAFLTSIAAAIWLGGSIAANLIAAPAKFTVMSLSQAELVAVGRVQFTWVGWFEWFMAALVAILFVILWKDQGSGMRWKGLILVFVLTLLVLQRLHLHPQLQLNPSQSLHSFYVAAEFFKALGLCGFLFLAWKHAF